MIQHTVKTEPQHGNGWQLCACGANRFVVDGIPQGDWHACPLCDIDHTVHADQHKEP